MLHPSMIITNELSYIVYVGYDKNNVERYVGMGNTSRPNATLKKEYIEAVRIYGPFDYSSASNLERELIEEYQHTILNEKNNPNPNRISQLSFDDKVDLKDWDDVVYLRSLDWPDEHISQLLGIK